MNVRFINEHNESVNEPNEIMVVHGILSQKTLQTFGCKTQYSGHLLSRLTQILSPQHLTTVMDYWQLATIICSNHPHHP